MARSTIDRPAVNSSCEELAHHWRCGHTTCLFDLAPGHRSLMTHVRRHHTSGSGVEP